MYILIYGRIVFRQALNCEADISYLVQRGVLIYLLLAFTNIVP